MAEQSQRALLQAISSEVLDLMPANETNDLLGADMADSDTPSRQEISAQLQAAEARTETRLAQMTTNVEVRFTQIDAKMDQVISSNTALSGAIGEIGKQVREDYKFTRWTLAVIGIAMVALVAASQANIIAAFSTALTALQAKPEPTKPASK